MNISQAPTGYLYSSQKRGKFDLLSYKGLEEEQKEKIKVITTHTVGLLRHLIKERGLLSGDIKRYEAELLALDNKLEYFVTLPLSMGTALGGFIFLGFDKKKTVDAQDLEFLDVFAMHASNALAKAGILR
jgi:transcriptional regulator with GAF, ATPase, and Fis domain